MFFGSLAIHAEWKKGLDKYTHVYREKVVVVDFCKPFYTEHLFKTWMLKIYIY